MKNEHTFKISDCCRKILYQLIIYIFISQINLCAIDEISKHSTTMVFCRKVYVIFLLTFVVFVVARDRHSNVNWAFRNRHSIRDDGYPCHRNIGNLRSSDSISIGAMSHLNVSTTIYVSLEQIEVTWMPILNPCRDDFIGIYFAETSILTGTNTFYA